MLRCRFLSIAYKHIFHPVVHSFVKRYGGLQSTVKSTTVTHFLVQPYVNIYFRREYGWLARGDYTAHVRRWASSLHTVSWYPARFFATSSFPAGLETSMSWNDQQQTSLASLKPWFHWTVKCGPAIVLWMTTSSWAEDVKRTIFWEDNVSNLERSLDALSSQ